MRTQQHKLQFTALFHSRRLTFGPKSISVVRSKCIDKRTANLYVIFKFSMTNTYTYYMNVLSSNTWVHKL